MFSAPLFRFKHGDHVCVFYKEESALVDFLVPYLLEGLRKGERCFCVQTPAVSALVQEEVRKQCAANSVEIVSGALEFHTADEVYFADGGFDPAAIVNLLKKAIAQTRGNGFSGMRTAGEMELAAQGVYSCDQLLRYERLVEEAFPGQPITAVCQYRLDAFEPGVMESVLEFHKQSLTHVRNSLHHSSLAFRHGRYVLDVVADRRSPGRQFYYVAQEQGKKEILGWGVEASFDAAMQQGESLLNFLAAD